MSFSYDIKSRLGKTLSECNYCTAAELYGILCMAGQKKKDGFYIVTEHEDVAERIVTLWEECMGQPLPERSEKKAGIQLCICDEVSIDRLYAGLLDESKEALMPFLCCKTSFLRGAFLGGGSISDPQKSYHLEFDAKTSEMAELICSILAEVGIEAKITQRKHYQIVYLKEYEAIAELLGRIGAGGAAMEIYNVSIEKEIRNDVNRRMNCENANMDKIVKAYGKHIMAIRKIERTIGLDALPEALREIALIRLEYPDESLKALGERLMTPIGKSGVNHRLNRLIEIADAIQ